MIQHIINLIVGYLFILIVVLVLGIVLFSSDKFSGLIIIYTSAFSIIELFIIYFILLYVDNRRFTQKEVIVTV